MEVSSSAYKWLGSATLAALILASSFPLSVSASVKTMENYSLSKSSLLASTGLAKETYPQAVRAAMPWVGEITAEKPLSALGGTLAAAEAKEAATAAEAGEATATAAAVAETDQNVPAISERQAVQIAEVQNQQVSRSQSPTLVDNAMSLVGVPYVFGGTSRNGFDCSGYTQYVFKGSGVSLPRTSWSQFNVGTSIEKDELQSGDLVFFTTYAKGPSHVGIYIGGGNFIHASNSGVKVTSLNDGYYAKSYLGARRVN